MRITQIRQILEIEKSGSITQAAKNLYISQPGLSATLNEFEEEIDIKLFQRSKNGIQVTEQGIHILAAMHRIMAEVTYIENFRFQSELSTGTILLSIGPAYDFLYEKVIQEFTLQFPLAKLKFIPQGNDSFSLRDIKKELMHIAVGNFDELNVETTILGKRIQKNSELAICPLSTVQTFAVLCPQHPKSTLQRLLFSEITSEHLIFSKRYGVEPETFYSLGFLTYPPISAVDRTIAVKLVEQNHNIFIDSSPLSQEQFQAFFPNTVVIPLCNDITPEEKILQFELPSYLVYRKTPENTLEYQFLHKILLPLLTEYQLLDS